MSTEGDANGALVLLAEDSADSRVVYAEFLRASGYRVAQAADGREAVVAARDLLPDVVVMDLSLPVLDGWTAIRDLKSDARTGHIPIVALSGHARAEHVARARAAGCDAFLAKPCFPATLLTVLRGLLDDGGARLE